MSKVLVLVLLVVLIGGTAFILNAAYVERPDESARTARRGLIV